MVRILSVFQQSYQVISKAFNLYSQPNPKYIPGRFQYEVTHKRNKVLLLIQLISIIIFLMNILRGVGSLTANIQNCVASVAIFCINLSLCRYHHEIFRIFYNIFLLIIGPFMSNYLVDGGIATYVAIQALPVYVYLYTGSLFHFVTNAFGQAILFKLYHERNLGRCLIELTPDEVLNSLLYNLETVYIFNLISIILTQYGLYNTYYQLAVADKEKDELIKQKVFILGFSHELRNVINSLTGNIKLASLEKVSKRVKEFLTNAEVCSEMLHLLVDNILDAGKVEADDLEINTTSNCTYSIIEKIWSISTELIKAKKLQGRLRFDSNIPKILLIDQYRLKQILLNLVDNAVKFTISGRIDISIGWIEDVPNVIDECFEPLPFSDEGLFEKDQACSILSSSTLFLDHHNKKIDQSLLSSRYSNKPGVLKVTVTDTGRGIRNDDIDKLFQKFSRINPDPLVKNLGTGLGLFITKEL